MSSSFFRRLPLLLRIALEKSILALLEGRRSFLSHTPPPLILHLTLSQSEAYPPFSDWDEQSHPYYLPFLSTDDCKIISDRYLQQTSAEIVYFDHCLKENSAPPFLKPEWSPELWLNVDILFGAAFNAAYLKRLAYQGDEKLIARAVLQAKHIEHVSTVMVQTESYPWQNTELTCRHRQNVQDYLNLIGREVDTIDVRPNGSLCLKWKPLEAMVSIIIPNRDNLYLLKRCIESIYASTAYPSYEILVVDDHSTDPRVQDYYRKMQEEKANFRVLEGKRPFNFSYACNQGAKHASGEYLLFLNNDTEVLDAEWLNALVGTANLPGVGAVGAKLIYPNGKVQHAGVVIGLEGHASHVFQGVSDDPFTPYGHVDWMRNVSAVTAACMLVRKEAFWQIGGFDEQFQIAFGDIDFCLRLGDAGYRIVYTPDVTLIHHEGKSRGKYIPPHDIRAKADYLLQKVALGDPYYHLALSRAWRIPTLRWRWEQDPVERLKKIIRYYG